MSPREVTGIVSGSLGGLQVFGWEKVLFSSAQRPVSFGEDG